MRTSCGELPSVLAAPSRRAYGLRINPPRGAVASLTLMQPGYRLVTTARQVDDYLTLRTEAGLSPKTRRQAEAALPGGWAACHIVYQPTDQVLGMGTVIGDGGWYFHVIDMAVLPEHQRRGLGDAILGALLDEVRDRLPARAYVNLLADPPGVRLYERHGFQPTAPGSVGMALWLNPEQ